MTDYGAPLPELAWRTSDSADEENHDQETDLAAIGNPGGAEWASASPDGRPGIPWTWGVYRRWLWEDIDADPERNILAEGIAGDEDEAKMRVAEWVREAQAGNEDK
jgi:hypothetical protein